MQDSIIQELQQLHAAGLSRSLHTLESAQGAEVLLQGRKLINFSSNDYLGLANSPELRAAMIEGVERYGAGSGASRLICGGSLPHAQLEQALATFKGTQAALTFSSGFAVAHGVIPALMGREDIILMDKLCHACLVDAAKLSGATLRIFPHNHLEKLERLLQTYAGKRILIITESIFSMDGDTAPLRHIVALKQRYGAWLMVDEAHAVGIRGPHGRGLVAEQELESQVELQMGTLSKALGLSGGYIASSQPVIDLLLHKARSFIYSTAPVPALAHAATIALQLCIGVEGEQRRRQLRTNLSEWGSTELSAIHPIIIGNEQATLEHSARLFEAGYLIPAIRYPTVAKGRARLRVTLTAAHNVEQIHALSRALRS
jgi:8-amino-7-oxononanoate synthase